MRILLILCHPQPGSFNHAVAGRARTSLREAGHEVLYHDLYQEGFDPVLTWAEYRRGVSFDSQVVGYAEELRACGGLLFVHPEWWGQPPALLKGWVDRVLRPGVAYEPADAEAAEGGQAPAPLLADKAALVLATRDEARPKAGAAGLLEAGAAGLLEAGAAGLLEAGAAGLLERVWLEGVFAFCGIRNASCQVLHGLRRLPPAGRLAWLEQVDRALAGMFPPPPQGRVQSSSSAR